MEEREVLSRGPAREPRSRLRRRSVLPPNMCVVSLHAQELTRAASPPSPALRDKYIFGHIKAFPSFDWLHTRQDHVTGLLGSHRGQRRKRGGDGSRWRSVGIDVQCCLIEITSVSVRSFAGKKKGGGGEVVQVALREVAAKLVSQGTRHDLGLELRGVWFCACE